MFIPESWTCIFCARLNTFVAEPGEWKEVTCDRCGLTLSVMIEDVAHESIEETKNRGRRQQ